MPIWLIGTAAGALGWNYFFGGSSDQDEEPSFSNELFRALKPIIIGIVAIVVLRYLIKLTKKP